MIALVNLAATCLSLCQCSSFRDSTYNYYSDEYFLPRDELEPERTYRNRNQRNILKYELYDNELRFDPVANYELLRENDRYWKDYPETPIVTRGRDFYVPKEDLVNIITVLKAPFNFANDTVSFVKKATIILEKIHDDFKADDNATAILEYIHEKLSKDPRKLALFVTSSFYNTSYFTNFKANSNKKFCARGLMMIAGEENYETLENLTDFNFTESPNTLSEPNRLGVYSTIDFFSKYMYKPSISVRKAFRKFVEESSSDASISEVSFKDFIKTYNKLYEMLLKK